MLYPQDTCVAQGQSTQLATPRSQVRTLIRRVTGEHFWKQSLMMEIINIGGSNLRPWGCESDVLSLSYAGVLWIQHSWVLSLLFKVILGGKRAQSNQRSHQPVRRGTLSYLRGIIIKMRTKRGWEMSQQENTSTGKCFNRKMSQQENVTTITQNPLGVSSLEMVQ